MSIENFSSVKKPSSVEINEANIFMQGKLIEMRMQGNFDSEGDVVKNEFKKFTDGIITLSEFKEHVIGIDESRMRA